MTVANEKISPETIEGAEIFLQQARRALLVWSRGSDGLQGLTEAPAFIADLEAKALGADLKNVAGMISVLNKELQAVIDKGSRDPESDALPLLDRVAAVEPGPAEVAVFVRRVGGFQGGRHVVLNRVFAQVVAVPVAREAIAARLDADAQHGAARKR